MKSALNTSHANQTPRSGIRCLVSRQASTQDDGPPTSLRRPLHPLFALNPIQRTQTSDMQTCEIKLTKTARLTNHSGAVPNIWEE
jgi:hypothetical protein